MEDSVMRISRSQALQSMRSAPRPMNVRGLGWDWRECALLAAMAITETAAWAFCFFMLFRAFAA